MLKPDPEAGDFTVDSELVGAPLPGDFGIDRAYLETLTLSAARLLVKESLNDGCSLFQYVGHANLNALAAESLFTRSTAGQLINGNRLPVMTVAGCSTGMFATPGYTGLGEKMLMRMGGGAVAVWSPSGSAYNENSSALLAQFMRLRYTEGERVTLVKNSASNSFSSPTWIASSPIGARQFVGGFMILTCGIAW